MIQALSETIWTQVDHCKEMPNKIGNNRSRSQTETAVPQKVETEKGIMYEHTVPPYVPLHTPLHSTTQALDTTSHATSLQT